MPAPRSHRPLPQAALLGVCLGGAALVPHCQCQDHDGPSFGRFVGGADDSGSLDSQPLDSDARRDTGPEALLPVDSQDPTDSGDPDGLQVDPEIAALDPYVQPDVWLEPYPPAAGEAVTVHYRGPLGAEDDLVLKYGFNGWGPYSDREQSYQYESWLRLYYEESAMTRIDSSTWEAEILLPEDARAVHMTFSASSDDGDLTDDNDGQHYAASVGFPYLGPWLTWSDQAPPASGVVISWETDLPCLGVVGYGASEALGTLVAGDETDTMHHVTLSGLDADTTWYYRVYDSSGRESALYTFHTAPTSPEAFTFLAMSDMQEEDEDGRWGDVASQARAEVPEAAFLLAPGDLTEADHPAGWWFFFDRGGVLLPWVPIVPVPGNHDVPYSSEVDLTSFRRYFPVEWQGDEETWYALDYGPLRVLGLNSELEDSLSDGEAQHHFVSEQLNACALSDTLCQWVIATWHIGPYNAGQRHYLESDDFRETTALFQGRVDWHISGHEHLYQRMQPLRYEADIAPSGAYGRGEDDGVGYMVLPPAGNTPSNDVVSSGSSYASLRDLLAWPAVSGEEDEVASEIGFVVVQVETNRLDFTTWGMGTQSQEQEPHVVETVTMNRE